MKSKADILKEKIEKGKGAEVHVPFLVHGGSEADGPGGYDML